MSRGPQAFRQADVRKALLAAKEADLSVQRFEIDRAGRIVITTGQTDVGNATEPERVAG